MSLFRSILSTFPSQLLTSKQTYPDETAYGARISVWVRWIILIAFLVEVNYRVDYGSISQVLNTLYVMSAMLFNGYVHYRLWTRKTVSSRLLIAISATDVAMITFSTSLSGGYSSRYFVAYYLAVALFASVFSSTRLNLIWVSMVAVIHVATVMFSGEGASFAEENDKVLIYRIGILYGVAGMVNLATRVERIRAREAIEREVELHRQRAELSHTIHDTTAQSAYIMSIGIAASINIEGGANEALRDKLDALQNLSKSIMWDLRHPIDSGKLFHGRDLAPVLHSHARTFTAITSVPTSFVQRGQEPRISTIARSMIFAIAHNALTNAFRHSHADNITVTLDFQPSQLVMSISDNGVGLPSDYGKLGHGFQNMAENAENLGGRLSVGSGPLGKGTQSACTIPDRQITGEV